MSKNNQQNTRFFTKTSKGAILKKLPLSEINYKNPLNLGVATSANGRILPARIVGANAPRQRLLAAQIKRARHLVLMPYN